MMRLAFLLAAILSINACKFQKEDNLKKDNASYVGPDGIADEAIEALEKLDERRQREFDEEQERLASEERQRQENDEETERQRQIEIESRQASLVLQPEFALNFQPDPNTPMFLPFVVANVPAAIVDAEVKAKTLDGHDLPDSIFLTGNREVTSRENGQYDVAVAIPFLVNDVTLNGFEATITIKNVKDKNGNPLTKKSRFVVNDGTYSAWHQAEDSKIKGFAVISEFLDTNFDGDLTAFVNMAIYDGRSVSTEADRDLIKIRENLEIVIEGEKRIINMKSDAFFSYSFPGEATIRTNGFRIGVAGYDWSRVTLEVGVNDEIRKNATPTNPEITLAAWVPPKLNNQFVQDEAEIYPAPRGARGKKAEYDRDCDSLVFGATVDLRSFRRSRALCSDNFRHLNGEDRTMLLIKKFSQTLIPITPQEASNKQFEELVKTTEEDGRSVYQYNREGARCTEDTCVNVDYDRRWFNKRRGGGYKPTEAFLTKVEESYDPMQKEIYYGQDKLVVVQNDNESSLVGGIASFDKSESVIYGSLEQWDIEATKKWANALCAAEIPKGIKEWSAPLGKIEKLEEPILTEDQEYTGTTQPFSNVVPGVYAITNIDASVQDDKSAITLLADTIEHLNDRTSIYRAGLSGNDFRLNGDTEQSLRALAPSIKVMGRAGADGKRTPILVAHLTNDVDQGQFLEDYTSLAGASGPHGYSIERVLSSGKFAIKVIAPGQGSEIPGYEVICDDKNPNCELKQDEHGYYVEFHGVNANLEAGRNVRLYYETHRVNANYLANYTDYKVAKGSFNVDRSFVMPLFFDPERASAIIGGASFTSFAGGGVRSGSNAAQLSNSYGFWNFRMSRKPIFFSSIGGLAGKWGKDLSNGFKTGITCPMGGACKGEEENEGFDVCNFDFGDNWSHTYGIRTYSKPQQKQSERVFSTPGTVDCREIFGGRAGQEILEIEGDWKIYNFQKQFFVSDENWPNCAGDNRTKISACTHRERRHPSHEKDLDNHIEHYSNNCVSRWLNYPWNDYENSMFEACKLHGSYVNARKSKMQNDANDDFVKGCGDDCRNTIENMGFLANYNDIEALKDVVTRINAEYVSTKEQRTTYTISHDFFTIKKLKEIKRQIDFVEKGKTHIFALHDKYGSEWLKSHKKIINSNFKGFLSKEELVFNIREYKRLIKIIEDISRPRIEKLVCGYHLNGVFRKFEKASVQSINLQPELEFSTETKLLSAYQYKNTKVKRRIVSPKLSPILPSELSLKETSTARSGRIETVIRSEVYDCADLANRMIELKAPIPIKMFLGKCS